MVKVDVDRELAYIIQKMKESKLVDKAIRNYAKTFLGLNTDKDWSEKFEEEYGEKRLA